MGSEADFARYRKLRASSRTQEAELPVTEGQGALILSAWEGWRGLGRLMVAARRLAALAAQARMNSSSARAKPS